ncbi:hypothetical protein FAUST_6580 [Fusarium austroamericanum]|uniref:Ankyrin n=1 Tax=Fusarium austroamericanum TaxID=282268 RepID=A0AAN6BZ91_FUSAU|nr:hypothetical protein FAUST_6580 [Fusarium austroamericanum]
MSNCISLPLNLSHISIAVAQGVDRVTSLLLRLKEAPAEVNHLITEITQAKFTFCSLQNVVLEITQRGIQADLDSLNQGLQHYAALLDSIQVLVAKHLLTSTSKDQKQVWNPVVDAQTPSRWGWATKKSQVVALREKLSNARQMIIAEMTILSSYLQLEIQRSLHDKLYEQGKVLGHILLLQTESTSGTAITSTCTSPTGFAALKTPVRTRTQTCKNCPCRCHFKQTWSATWWKSWAGSLSLSTTGNPFLNRPCNVRTCRHPSTPRASGIFYFPHWIATRVILLTLINGPSISVSVDLVRIVSADTEFFRSIQVGRCDKVQELLEAGQASPGDMVELPYGTLSALLFALNNGQVSVCKVLMSWEADPHLEHTTSLTSTAADMAWNMSQEAGILSITAKEDRLDDIFPFPRDFDRRQFSHLTKIVLGFSGYDLEEALRVATAIELSAMDCYGRAVAHWAAWKGITGDLHKIILAGTDLDIADFAGRTPLHYSSMTSSSNCTALLASSGANVNKSDNFGETPLHCACLTGRESNVAYLLSAGADGNIEGHKGRTPLMSAVVCSNVAVVQLLLQHGVDVEVTDIDGESAATLAVWTNRHDILRVLVLDNRARLDVITSSCRTILHTAAQHGDVYMIQTLLDLPLGTLQSSALDDEGLSPLDRLRERKDLTQELNESFGALIIKTSTWSTCTLFAREPFPVIACDGRDGVQNVKACSVSCEEEVFLPALETQDDN